MILSSHRRPRTKGELAFYFYIYPLFVELIERGPAADDDYDAYLCIGSNSITSLFP